jgi:hypothetical protein
VRDRCGTDPARTQPEGISSVRAEPGGRLTCDRQSLSAPSPSHTLFLSAASSNTLQPTLLQGMLAGQPEGGRLVLSAQVSSPMRVTVIDRWSLPIAGRCGTRVARPIGSGTGYTCLLRAELACEARTSLGHHLPRWQAANAARQLLVGAVSFLLGVFTNGLLASYLLRLEDPAALPTLPNSRPIFGSSAPARFIRGWSLSHSRVCVVRGPVSNSLSSLAHSV